MKIISILCLNSFKASTLLGICQFISNHFPHDTMVDILRDGHISRTEKTGKQMVFPQYSIQAWPLVHIILTLLPLTLKAHVGETYWIIRVKLDVAFNGKCSSF